ncbi:MAG: hypothetical protein Q9191_008397, partial [Dirinaria sp. TL-2023a]
IHEEVDASISEGAHAAAVITGRIHVVHSYSIGAQLLHRRCVELALIFVKERVRRDKL